MLSQYLRGCIFWIGSVLPAPVVCFVSAVNQRFSRRNHSSFPQSTLRALRENKHRSRKIDLAKACIRHIMIRITSFQYKCDFGPVPECHLFDRLCTLTFVAPDSLQRILENDIERRLWPQAPPKKLICLLAQLGFELTTFIWNFPLFRQRKLVFSK